MKPARFWSTASEEPFRAPCFLPPFLLPNFCSLCKVQLFHPASVISLGVKTLCKPLEFLLSRDMRETVIYKEEAEQQEVTISQQTNRKVNKTKHDLLFFFADRTTLRTAQQLQQ